MPQIHSHFVKPGNFKNSFFFSHLHSHISHNKNAGSVTSSAAEKKKNSNHCLTDKAGPVGLNLKWAARVEAAVTEGSSYLYLLALLDDVLINK